MITSMIISFFLWYHEPRQRVIDFEEEAATLSQYLASEIDEVEAREMEKLWIDMQWKELIEKSN